MVPDRTNQCAECGRDLPPRAGRGRRRRFCDATCRSAARRRRAGTSPTTCELSVGGHTCPHPADGEVRLPQTPDRVRVCGGHRPVAEALLSERYPGACWWPYPLPAGGHEGSAGVYRLRFTDDDGWELLRAGDVIAGHDGFGAHEAAAAQRWAASELLDDHGVRVLGWTTRTDAGQIEHVVILYGHDGDPDAQTTGSHTHLPPDSTHV